MELCFYMGLLQFALGLSRTNGESPKDSYSTKPRESPACTYLFNSTFQQDKLGLSQNLLTLDNIIVCQISLQEL